MKAAVILLPLLVAPSVARAEQSESEKRMFAAAVVLSGTTGILNGQIVTKSDKYADFRPGYNTEQKIHFEMGEDCVYYEVVDSEVRQNWKMVRLDFNKLNGRWWRDGYAMILGASGQAQCTRDASGVHCYNGAIIIDASRNQLQMLNDLYYVLRHGCGAASADPDPY